MITNTCEFSNGVYWDKDLLEYAPLNGTIRTEETWNFKNLNCTSTDSVEILIQNSETGAEFYVEKTLNYGEAILIWFATLFSFYLIFKFAYNFFWKK